MEEGVVYQYRCMANSIKPSTKEVYRYLGINVSEVKEVNENITSETEKLVDESIEQMQVVLKPSALYASFSLEFEKVNEEDLNLLPDLRVKNNSVEKILKNKTNENPRIIKFAGQNLLSYHLYRNLKGCSRVVLFAATIGPQVDAMIRRYAKIDSARAAVLQATGSMFVEAFVDEVNSHIAKDFSGCKLHPRFSPGFGDVSLEVQTMFFSLLSCTQKIGLTLTDSFIMAPEKSVTGFIGVE